MITWILPHWQRHVKAVQTRTHTNADPRSLILSNTHTGHFHNAQRTRRRRELERAKTQGEEVSTLLDGLVQFPRDSHTHRSENAHDILEEQTK